MSTPGRPRPTAGAATLIVVMVIFFVLSLAAAYASRNMIFEQRTSANQYRSTQAFEAAEAGLEWTLGMLNSGRIDAACLPTSNPGAESFRERYLSIDAATSVVTRRLYTAPSGQEVRLAGCVRTDTGWDCACPDSGDPVLAATVGAGAYPAFRVRFVNSPRAGTTQVFIAGCTSHATSCLAGDPPAGTGVDAAAEINQVFAVAHAIATPPAAALTARGSVAMNVGAPQVLSLVNGDPAGTGLTVHAGGAVQTAGLAPATVAGADPAGSVSPSDPRLPRATPADFFASVFGMPPEVYRRQPAVVRLSCAPAGCGAALAQAVADNPGRPIWVAGNLRLDTAVTLGSSAEPVVIVSEGNVAFDVAGSRITGLVYALPAALTLTGPAVIEGALVAQGDVGGVSAAAVRHDAEVLRTIARRQGSFVRVPGGWRDFR